MIMQRHWESLCVKLKQARQFNYITQYQMGDIIGYSQQTISDFENGKIRNAIILSSYCVMFPEAKKAYDMWIKEQDNAENRCKPAFEKICK